MSHTLHIIRKDMRHLRWAWLAWLVIVVASVLLTVAVASLEGQGFAMAIVARQLISLTSLIQLVMLCLIVSRLVHEDPAADREAFWLTRPIAPADLAVAKVTFAAAVLVLLPLIGQWVTMAIFRVGLYDMWRATQSILLGQIAWMLALTAAATLTPSLTRYALVLVGVAAGFVLLMSATFTILLLIADPKPTPPGPQISDPIPTVAATVLVIAISLCVVLYQYRRRHVRVAATIGTAGLLMSLVLPALWPFHINRPLDPDPGEWARDQTHAVARVGSASPRASEEMSFGRRDTSRKQIAIPLSITGIPADEFVSAVATDSRLEVPGATLQSTQSAMVNLRRGAAGEPSPNLLSSVRGALGNMQLLESPTVEGYEEWPVVLTLADQDFLRYSHSPGRLSVTAEFHLARSMVAGAIPLASGGELKEDTRRMEIVRIDRRTDGCTVTLRDVFINPLLRPRPYENEFIVLRNRARGEALMGSQDSFARGESNPLMPFLVAVALGGDAYAASGSVSSGFVVRTVAYRFPGRSADGNSANPLLDASWLAGAEVVRIKSGYAGHVTRSLTINDFRMVQ
jgi:hypothetical protein